ncbi:uncharacterized protein FIBRA_03020 [Fibroporia radiculosa]|uniref:Uncharacterized protein n=1 Tax=Fibroporia radiculosa TaxID=599839 RepID=J4HVR5_9APHY|nr:uncharacterized protein FIBRA_03020 [Fibroporia radiculosa]CCM00972.1 predicted protein [Fibroporia radiculosa]
MPISILDLESAIRSAIPIIHLEIIDQSNGCGENYAVFVVSSAFEGKNTLARHRFSECDMYRSGWLCDEDTVNELLKNQIAQMHAFSQRTLTPKQYEVQQIAIDL